ncbi:MAG: YopX family protein [Faecalimonas sp.]
MNREILFKAKRKSWKELPKEEWWVEGYLFDDGMPEPKHYFIGGIIVKPYEGTACDKWNVVGIDFCEIDINTICQYTGLTDKNGKKIWENDIISINAYSYDEPEDDYFGVVTYCEKDACWSLNNNEKYGEIICECFGGYTTEIINHGNIFDNPELLEVE